MLKMIHRHIVEDSDCDKHKHPLAEDNFSSVCVSRSEIMNKRD